MSTEEDEYRSSDDEDYVPEGVVEDDVDEPSGDECDEVTSADDPDAAKRGRGRRRKGKKGGKEEKVLAPAAPPADEVDDFFASLMANDPYAIKATPAPASTSSTTTTRETKKAMEEKMSADTPAEPSPTPAATSALDSTTKITEVFDFAGQEIKVEKEVTLEEAKAHEEKLQKQEEATKKPVIKRVGLGDALTMIAKKPKMSVLDKSNLDWSSFKQEQKITEDLAIHNRGKNGYLNKQDFLIKADHAQFEKERAMRDAIRKQNQ